MSEAWSSRSLLSGPSKLIDYDNLPSVSRKFDKAISPDAGQSRALCITAQTQHDRVRLPAHGRRDSCSLSVVDVVRSAAAAGRVSVRKGVETLKQLQKQPPDKNNELAEGGVLFVLAHQSGGQPGGPGAPQLHACHAAATALCALDQLLRHGRQS